jgi:hypothetical protein
MKRAARKSTDFTFDERQAEAFCGRLYTDRPFYEPLEEVRFVVDRNKARSCQIYVYDSDFNLYAGRRLTLRNGKGAVRFRAAGSAGTHLARVWFNDNTQRYCFFRVRPATCVVTGKPEFDHLQGYLEAISAKCCVDMPVNGRRVSLSGRAGDTTTFLWFRDGTYGLLGYVYWHPFLKDFCDYFLATQDGTGLFRGSRRHLLDLDRGESFGRCTNEPDLEYIAVMAVHRAWQATGDDDWMRRHLPALERGMRACMRTRDWDYEIDAKGRPRPQYYLACWDGEHGLIKRTHTCDTWDFQMDSPDGKPVFVVATCDQSGFFAALKLLARMNRALGRKQKTARWAKLAREFRRRAIKTLWDGQKFRHHVHVDELDHGDFDESEQLAMGNTWAVTRGLATHRQAVSIINEYRKRWRRTGHKWPWWSLQPGYPDGTFDDQQEGSWAKLQGMYANGGLIPWVGGELALASLKHGAESFGVKQIRLYHELLDSTRGGNHTWYWPDGTPGLSTPESSDHSIWDIGAWMRALQEGLAGIEDAAKVFDEILCSPRWSAAGVAKARAVSHYPDSFSYFGYVYHYRKREREIAIDFSGSGRRVRFSVLLPSANDVRNVSIDGEAVPFKIRKVEQSRYCEFRAKIRRTVAPQSFSYLRERREQKALPRFPFDLNRVCVKMRSA